MKTTRRTLATLSFLGLFVGSTVAPATALAADSAGASGRVTKVTVNTSGSDEFAQSHGAVSIRTTGKKGRTSVYKWGGSLCPGRNLTPDQVQLLVLAMARPGAARVTPRYKKGQANTRCLVSFDISGPGAGGPS